MASIIGVKCGMSRFIDNNQNFVPVTLIKILDNRIIGKKTIAKDNYEALVVKISYYKKPYIREVSYRENLAIGELIPLTIFNDCNKVKVTGTSRGKGFAGVIRRWGFAIQFATHGTSLAHRSHGSTGQNSTPSRVFKGKKMAGHLGNVKKTVNNLELLNIDYNQQTIALKGAVPGPKGGLVMINTNTSY